MLRLRRRRRRGHLDERLGCGGVLRLTGTRQHGEVQVIGGTSRFIQSVGRTGPRRRLEAAVGMVAGGLRHGTEGGR